jgi:hypothetical protein
MIMSWFLPLGLLIGFVGTRTALKARHSVKTGKNPLSWWLLVILAWLPSFCWIMAQFVDQY